MSLKILVADDDRPLRESIRQLLTKLGHEVLEAGDGACAMNLLEDNPDINAVITDMQMPRANGLDLLQHMFRRDITPRTYVHSGESIFLFNGEYWQLSQDIETYFGTFASFRTKGPGMMRYISEFVASLSTAAT
jgi:DNA-binding LytR/AlgR family response regulator